MQLVRPARLRPGDTVAAVSLSWGGAGDPEILWRYRVGKTRLEEQFGLRVVEMAHTLRGADYLYRHPEARAADLMQAFSDPSVKGIVSCIGGEESIRMLPYIDFDVIRSNPKLFTGYSDSTTTHLICAKAGVSSFYGPSLLAEFAENGGIFDYTAHWVHKVFFDPAPIGVIEASPLWTGEEIPWTEENAGKAKTLRENRGYEWLQGRGVVRGRLWGGCMEVLEMAKGTDLWPAAGELDGAVLFFERSEELPGPANLEYWLRNYGSQGILQRAAALLFGKPCRETHYEAYKASILKILAELDLHELPVVYNLSFGHNEPMCILPYGALAEVDCENKTVSILESGVV